ncbi:hypothetical protein [Massilia sp. CCM 8734]|uniref:hypothetical protein n=1 Tax=Massilia sp. CCM 8734 TaxID=2609283 RepID=UPI00141E762C|nr:hypothetical protein [Massilia sp. CCM 8734]NHZ94159.1 hypothetical protein [Massilia sp. CCM 8734]
MKNVDLPIRATYGRHAGEPDVVLGSDVFRAYKICFANSQRQVYLSRSGPSDEDVIDVRRRSRVRHATARRRA